MAAALHRPAAPGADKPRNNSAAPTGRPGRRAERGKLKTESITLRGLVTALTGEIAWMRIYPGGWRAPPMELHDWDASTDAVRAFGDCPVRTIMPGYRFVIVVLE